MSGSDNSSKEKPNGLGDKEGQNVCYFRDCIQRSPLGGDDLSREPEGNVGMSPLKA